MVMVMVMVMLMESFQVLRERQPPGRRFTDREERGSTEAEMSSAHRAGGLLHLESVRSHWGISQDMEGERNQGSLTPAQQPQCSILAVKYLQVCVSTNIILRYGKSVNF